MSFLKKRAKTFLQNAEFNFRNKKFDVAAFNAEQFCQLYLKAKVLELVGDFPKTRSLVELLNEISFISNEVKKFLKQNIETLTKLEDVYITSRYIPRKFFKEEVQALLKFSKNFKKFIDKL